MFEKLLAFFRRKPAATVPEKRVPGQPPKPAPVIKREPGTPPPPTGDEQPSFDKTLMIRRPPPQKKPEEGGGSQS